MSNPFRIRRNKPLLAAIPKERNRHHRVRLCLTGSTKLVCVKCRRNFKTAKYSGKNKRRISLALKSHKERKM